MYVVDGKTITTLNSDIHYYDTRSRADIHLISYRGNFAKLDPRYSGSKFFTKLPS